MEEAFSVAFREDFRITKVYIKPSIVTVVQPSGPGPIDIDVI